MSEPAGVLYIWLGKDPISTEPDTEIEDVPGESDLALLAAAIADGRFGRHLPLRIAFSSHPTPNQPNIRSIDVARMLREYRIPHQRCYELLLDGEKR
jgi:hypothetical protein